MTSLAEARNHAGPGSVGEEILEAVCTDAGAQSL